MASSKQVLLLLAAVAAVACLSSPASATVWVVGDDEGWRPQFNETGWANGKTFVVGDSLLFKYTQGNHTVAKVGKEAFVACDLSSGVQLGNWTSGHDVVPLDKPGKAWFICTVPTHCTNGMKLKLVIDVVPATAPALSPWFLPSSPLLQPAPTMPLASPPSAAVRYPVCGALATAAAAVVAAALAF